MSGAADGRVFEKILVAPTRRADGKLVVIAPRPGLFRGGPSKGQLVHAHAQIGELEVLGVLHLLHSDATAHGLVVSEPASPLARRAVGYGDALFELDPSATLGSQAAAEQERELSAGLHVVAPSSGRFYTRPAPGKPPFVAEGQVLTEGSPIALLEVMKTFNRITYDYPDLPERARVLKILVEDGADVETGQPLLQVEDAGAA